MISRSIACLMWVIGAVTVLQADTSQSIGDWDTVTVAPMKTSIYVGSVALNTGEFRREGEKFATTYEAKVWPWFFWNENGHITITLAPSSLEKLAKGERVEFSGEAINSKGKPRTVTGRADRANAATGKIKVRIKVDGTELIFNGNYRFNNVMK